MLRAENGSDSIAFPATAKAIIDGQNGITAKFIFTEASKDSPLHVRVMVYSGLNATHNYHVHVKSVPADGNCYSTLGHFNTPEIISKNQTQGGGVLEAGDLSGKHGPLKGSVDGYNNIDQEYDDPELSLSGENSIVGRSIVIHAPVEKIRLACATIELQKDDEIQPVDPTNSTLNPIVPDDMTSNPDMNKSGGTMRAVVWHGNTSVGVDECGKPTLTEPTDVIVRMTATTICGSDLHLYHNTVQGMKSGDVLGHEAIGIVHQVGSQVKNFKEGERVAISAVIACGKCEYCQRGLFSCCDTTNPSRDMEQMYGHRTAGLFGYSHLTGGYEGTQAEYIRVPFADVNLLQLPSESELSDEDALLLCDVACTGWHANERGHVTEGRTVAVWGCGPVGLMAQIWAKYRGASRIIAIDNDKERLQLACEYIGVETIDATEHTDVVKRMQEICPGGVDCAIDCVGFRFPKTMMHKVSRALMLETDAPEVVSECIKCVKKGGSVSLIGDYVGTCNQFPIGALMEKSVCIHGGQVLVQKYWKDILDILKNQKVKPDPGKILFTHRVPFKEAPKAYSLFDKHEDGCVKVMLKPEE
ncbi:uncharacterized protein VTP21DRAFT_5571 [Calcarisporiella thermophila]|uniref:uncharacterized protein n=1 Tax=Calcarisporiella thermophila TaxID=911321 RepID=UPI003743679E